LRQHLEPRERSDTEEFRDTLSSQGDIEVLSDASGKSVTPDGPAITHDGFRLRELQQMVNCLHHSTVSAR
jgi:hypothetical protein